MQRFWSSLAVQLGKRAGLVSVVGLLLTVGLGLGISKLEFATGQDSYLNSDDPIAQDNVAYQNLFGGDAMLGVVTMAPGHTITDIFDDSGRQQMQAYYDKLTATGRYQAVITPLVALKYTDVLTQGPVPGGDATQSVAGQALVGAIAQEPPGSTQATARTDAAVATIGAVNAIPADQRTVANPAWNAFLLFEGPDTRPAVQPFFPDQTHALILVRLKGNLSIEDAGADATFAKDEAQHLSFTNASVTFTGAPVLLKDINDYLRGGMALLGGVALAIMALILLVLFDVRWRLLPLGVITVGIIWAFGLAGYLGIPLTIVTIAGLPVMMGIGIDYAIQMHARVEEETERSDHPIQAAARNLGPALLIVTFDAIFAFLALRFAKVPMIRDFGLLLAVGIAVICLASIVVPLAALGIREYRSPTPRKEFRPGPLGHLVVKLGSLPQSVALVLAVGSIAIFVGGIVVEDKLEIQTDPVQWVNQSSQTIKDIHEVEHQVGSSSELGVYLTTTNVFTDENVAFMHKFDRQALEDHGPNSANPTLLSASSMEAIVGDLMIVPGGSNIVPTGKQVEDAYNLAPPDLKAILVSPDHKAANILFKVTPGPIVRNKSVVEAIRTSSGAPEGTRVTPSGLAVVGVGLLENLESNRILLTYLAMLFVFLFLAVRLRSVIRAVLSMVPVAIAVGAASLIAWAFSFTLSPMTAVGGPLVIAACTEFTSLILLRFVEERGRGLEPQEAVDVVALHTGRAFIVSGLTAIAGVAVLSFSSLPLLRDFGRIVAMNVTVALLSALIVLPPLLVWAERRGWVSRGMIKPEEPYIPLDRESQPTLT